MAYIGEHHVLIQFPLIKQAGNCRTSSAFVRGGTELSHASSMAAGARNLSTGTDMGSHPPLTFCGPFSQARQILLTKQPSRGTKKAC